MSALAPNPGDHHETATGHRYRLITGPDDAEFCRRVSGALDDGYVLYGSPAITFDGLHGIAIAAQAVVRPEVAR